MGQPDEYSPHQPSVVQLLAEELGQGVGATGAGISRGIVVEINAGGEILVQTISESSNQIRCDFLETSQGPPLALSPGDLVLLLLPYGPDQNGCVLGRVGRYRTPKEVASDIQDHVVIEAGEMLTLLCGESSINLRKDGKLMIRGADVLSKAKGTQRIKGGTVAIN